MLVLIRCEGDATLINTTGGEIVVPLEQAEGSQAKVGINAQESVLVLREELPTTG